MHACLDNGVHLSALAVTVLAFIFAGLWELLKEFMKSKVRL